MANAILGESGMQVMIRGAIPRSLVLTGLLAFAVAVQARSRESSNTPTALPWATLNAQERQVLEAARKYWDKLPPGLQQRWRERADRWQILAPGQRARLHRHWRRWSRLTPEQRTKLVERITQFEQLPAEQRRRIRRAFRHFRQLPPAQRHRLRQQFEQMTPRQRRAVLAAMRNQAGHPRPAESIRSMPKDQRHAAVRLLRELTSSQRHAFMRTLRDMPPNRRAGYLRHMLNMAPAERAAELGKREPHGSP